MKEELTIREKITIRLVIFLIQLLKPYQFESQFKDVLDSLKELTK